MRGILRDKIAKTKSSRGILFDGMPKMVGEAQLVAQELKRVGRREPLVMYLHIPVAEVFRRMMKRGRKDDTASALRNRIAYYRNNVAYTIAFFKTIYVFKKISGIGSRDAVAKKIKKEIEKYLKNA